MMIDSRRIVAVGLLTQADLDLLGQTFDRAFPLEEETLFDDLLSAIDRAEMDHCPARGQEATGC